MKEVIRLQVLIEQKSMLSLYDQYNKIDNVNALILGGTGSGKSLALETILEQLHELGYVVIYLTDVKDKYEAAFSMFEPRERWHQHKLKMDARHVQRQPGKKSVQLWHPFTFALPSKKLPDINFFTIPIRSLGKEELSLIAETKMETSPVRLFFDALKDLKKDEGISDLLFYAGQKVETKTKVSGTKMIRKPDPKNFYLKAPVSGTQKTLSDISTYFRPYFYGDHYFLTPDNCKYNFDPMKILTNQKDYHVIVTNFLVNEYNVKDEKISDVVLLNLYKSILRNVHKSKHPVVFGIEEIRRWLPKKPEGHKKYLVESMKDDFSISRSKTPGVTTICTSQVYRDIAPSIAGSMSPNEVYIMGTSDQKDLDNMQNNLKLTTDDVRVIGRLEQNECIRKTVDGNERFMFLTPQHMHAEPKYDFFKIYSQEYPNQMKKYKDVSEYMKNLIKEEILRIKDKSEGVAKSEKEVTKIIKDRRKKKKMESIGGSDKTPKINSAKEVMRGVTVEMAKKWKHLYIDKEMSMYEIAKMYNLFTKSGRPYANKIKIALNRLNELEEDNT